MNSARGRARLHRALQHLPARQRAVLILRDVLGFSARETARVLETTPVSVDSALQRAHRTVDERLPSHTQQETLRQIGDDELSQLVDRFLAAWERNDVDAVVYLLPRTPGWSCRRCRPGQRPRPRRRLPARIPALGRQAMADGSDVSKWPTRACDLQLGRADSGVHAAQPERPHPARRQGRRDHRLHDPEALSHFNLPASIAG
jgi:hypothetical protein